MVIKQDEHRYWSSQTGEIGESYAMLKQKHDKLLESMPGVGSATTEASENTANSEAQDVCSLFLFC